MKTTTKKRPRPWIEPEKQRIARRQKRAGTPIRDGYGMRMGWQASVDRACEAWLREHGGNKKFVVWD